MLLRCGAQILLTSAATQREGVTSLRLDCHSTVTEHGLLRTPLRLGWLSCRKGCRMRQNTERDERAGEQGVRSSRLSHAGFFVAGVLVAGLVAIAVGPRRSGERLGARPEGEPRTESSASAGVATGGEAAARGAVPPWGELEITPLVLDRPDELFETNDFVATEIRWLFPGRSREQVAALVAACELTAEQKAALLDPKLKNPTTND